MKTKLLFIVFSLFYFSANAQDNCLQFNGAATEVEGQQVLLPNSATLDALKGATVYTIEAWVKPMNSSVYNNRTIVKRWGLFALQLYSPNTLNPNRFSFTVYNNKGDGTNGTTFYNTTANCIIVGQWNHIAVVCDGTNTKLYANGVEVTGTLGSTTVASVATTYVAKSLEANPILGSVSSPYVATDGFYVGAGGNVTFFNGFIDKIRVKIEAVAVATMQTAITSPAYTTDANTVVLMNFNEGAGTVTANEVTPANADLQCTISGCTTLPNWVDAATAYVNESALTYFSIYPNPVANQNLIIAPKVDQIIQEVALSDALGRKIFSNTYNASTPIEISTQNLKSGVYFINIKNQTGVVSAKIMVE